MLTSIIRVLSVAAVAVVLAAIGFASQASARSSHKIEGVWTITKIKQECDSAGGTFVPGDGHYYGCTKANCDGKGGSCDVSCNNAGSCQGVTPAIAHPRPGFGGARPVGPVEKALTQAVPPVRIITPPAPIGHPVLTGRYFGHPVLTGRYFGRAPIVLRTFSPVRFAHMNGGGFRGRR